ncbi:hypothetical protein AC249_AIPGENE21844 [Exaiptasia diaphana]|nr:hypothetical protein AC249_AIPGENE21844 [Exaiptasia diaphana]
MLYDDDTLDEEDVLMMFQELTRKNTTYPYWKYDRIEHQLNDISTGEFKTEFRFNLSEIDLLQDALQIPERFICDNGTVASGTEGLLLLLKRFAYPCRLSDMIPRFGRSVPEMSLILAEVTDHISSNFSHLLTDLNQPWLQRGKLERYAQAIHDKGGALDNCWGFVDGTVRPISRPGENQRVMYNGLKRVHGIKFQSIATPDGMIANLFGPVEGRRHDASMLRMSGVLEQLPIYSLSTAGAPLCIYGDPAYPLRVHLMAPYRSANITPNQDAFNKSMSSVRVAVEWRRILTKNFVIDVVIKF